MKDSVAIRKRAQIAQANRTMFLWIVVASVLVGGAIVVSSFLVQKLVYGEKVLGAKQTTVNRLADNNKVVGSLEDEIRALDANDALNSVKANSTDQAIQVVLDALPADANSLALGASLQSKLLSGIDGLSIETLQVDPVSGVETDTSSDTVDASASDTASDSISFHFSVKGNEDALRQVLSNLERSIRTIQVVSARVEMKGDVPVLTVAARAFYLPAKTIELTKELVKP